MASSLLTSLTSITSDAQVAAAIAAAVGGAQMEFVESWPGISPSWGIAAPTQNMVFLYRKRVAKAVTITNMKVFVGAENGDIDVGIYTSADNGVTFDRVAHSGPIAQAGSNAIQTLPLLASYQLLPNVDYWLAYATNGTGTTMRVSAGATAAQVAISNQLRSKSGAWSSGLPATLSSLTDGSTHLVWVWGGP